MPQTKELLLSSLRIREAFSEGSIDEIALADNREYAARVFPMERAIYVRGWALDGNARTPASEVRLLVDGSLEIPTTYGHARQDISTVFGSMDLSRCGFEATIPPILGPGDHGLEAYAIDADGGECFCVASLTLHVVPTLVPRAYDKEPSGWALGRVEVLANDDDVRSKKQRADRYELLIGGGCIINGWGFERNSRTTLVEVGAAIDCRWYVQGNPGIERPDVAAIHGVPSITACGFAVRFALNFVDPGPHVLQVVGRLPRGGWLTVGSPVEFEAIAPPLPWIWALTELTQGTNWGLCEAHYFTREELKSDSILPDTLSAEPGSALFLSGWAVDKPAATPAAGIYFSIDGDRRNPIPGRYGLAMPAVPSTHGNRPWSDCGFTALLPIEDLEPGEHSVEALIVSRNWNGYYPVEVLRFSVASDDTSLPVSGRGRGSKERAKAGRQHEAALVRIKLDDTGKF